MSRGTYRPAEDAWRHRRCQNVLCTHLASAHHGDVGSCSWCDCTAYQPPTEEALAAADAEIAARHEQTGGTAA